MNCDEFLRGYSDFRDGRLRPDVARGFREHLQACRSCSRYHHVVEEGVQVLRSLPPPSPSADFLPRLKHRIYHVDDGIPMHPGWPGGSAALVAVATVGLLALAWLPFASRMPLEVELAPVAVDRPVERATSRRAPSLFDRGPFVTPAVRSGEGTRWEGAARSASNGFAAGTAWRARFPWAAARASTGRTVGWTLLRGGMYPGGDATGGASTPSGLLRPGAAE